MPGVVPPAQGGSYHPGGRPPVPPGARGVGPDRKERDRFRPPRAHGDGREDHPATGHLPGEPAGPATGGRAGKAQADSPVRRRPGAVGGAALPAATSGGPFAVGQDVEVVIADVAQGGWCVARPDGLPVMFVRHALPGERVVARVTEVTSKFARADAVRVLEAAPDRVAPPCGHARPGGCGGCDWQHASLPAQRALKAAVVAQQLRRLAGIDLEVTVEPMPGDTPETAAPGSTPGLGWRTRVQFAVGPDGVAGLRGHRSHKVIDIGDCPLAHEGIRELDIPGDDWAGAAAVEVAVGGADAPDNLAVTVIEAAPPHGGRGRQGRGKQGRGQQGRRQGAGQATGSGRLPGHRRTLVEGRPYLAEQAAGRIWQVGAEGFWQVHPAAADTLSEAVIAALAPEPGDSVLDLYCGAGLFAGAVAPRVGPGGAVTGIESDPAAVKSARQNLGDLPWVTIHRADVAQFFAGRAVAGEDAPTGRLVIADPPRAGLAREVVDYLAGDNPAERFAYVSCDPATLARDLSLLAEGGWRLAGLRAFDAFPMTHHVECVAILTR
jgi:tRNA/tmRNA/rRNA uracil-C5-methylase (TrmA/RlmC/RlmD family)